MRNVFLALALIVGSLQTVAARSNNNSYGSWDTGTGSNAKSERVSGYTKENGTYVEPYYRTSPNNTVNDNYGTRGNENPYTGKVGRGQTDYDRQVGSVYGNRK